MCPGQRPHDDGVDGPNKDIPIYLTVLSPYLAGLPYDFDQVRTCSPGTWNLKDAPLRDGVFARLEREGYLPIKTSMGKDPYGKAALAQTPLPTFTYRVLAADAGPVIPDPVTGNGDAGTEIAKIIEGNLKDDLRLTPWLKSKDKGGSVGEASGASPHPTTTTSGTSDTISVLPT